MAFGVPDQEILGPPETALERRYSLRFQAKAAPCGRSAVITAYNGRCAVSCLLGQYGRAVNRDPNVHSQPLQRYPTFDCPRLQSINKRPARHHSGAVFSRQYGRSPSVRPNAAELLRCLERAKGFEPSTPTLGSLCSTSRPGCVGARRQVRSQDGVIPRIRRLREPGTACGAISFAICSRFASPLSKSIV